MIRLTRLLAIVLLALLATGSDLLRGQASDEIVLYASRGVPSGGWGVVSAASAAGGEAMRHSDAGGAKIRTALAAPVHFFEIRFEARAGVAYHLWLRARAERDHWANDSVHVQFSGAVDAAGNPIYRIGTTSSAPVALQGCTGCDISGWGWEDNGWNGLGDDITFATTGQQTIRVQTREDGLAIDQIVLSAAAYLRSAPGAATDDGTILPASGGSDAPTLVRGPYVQSVGASSAAVVWATREATVAELNYRKPGGTVRTRAASSTSFPASSTGLAYDYYQHVARLSGLAAATDYEYDPLAGGVDLTAGTDRLRTAPLPGDGTMRFVAFSDSGIGSTEQRDLAALIAGDTFDLAIHGGDVAYGNSDAVGAGSYPQYHDWFFRFYEDWLRARPMFPSLGNHDSRKANGHGRAYLDMFVLPENGASASYPNHAERFYSFDFGPVHFVALDTTLAFQDTSRRAAQVAWLEADLADTAQPWKIAYFHRPPYSSGRHGSDLAVRAAFVPLFERYGVQLVIAAHDHLYERSIPWRESDDPNDQAVTYVVSGGGGGHLYEVGTSAWTALSASRHHYVRGQADGCDLTLEAVGLGGGVFDRVTLSRCGGTPPPTSAEDVVLHAADATVLAGGWRLVPDSEAASGARAVHPDAGGAKLRTALASPTDYVELVADVEAGVPYHFWLRGRAENDHWANDSVHVQFSGTVDDAGSPIYRIGTTSSAPVALQDCSGCEISGWGWQDNGWEGMGPHLRFAMSGPQTIRIQTREDGLSIDQVVLSPSTWLNTAPGAVRNDSTILPSGGTSSAAGEAVLHAADATTLAGAWRLVADNEAASGARAVHPDAGGAKLRTALASPANYFELVTEVEAGVPYHFWLRGRAKNDHWANDSVHVQFSSTVDEAGSPIYRIGTTSSAPVALQDCSGCEISGWGWQDNGWEGMGPDLLFAASGPQTIRIQTREDGFSIDQVVLSPAAWLNTPPGAVRDDSTILATQ